MESKREDLVAATKSLLWELGYEAMSPKKIMRESGAGQGSLYHHFTGKMDLAVAALNEIEAEMHDEFDRIFNVDKPPLERLRHYLNAKRNGLKGCRLGRLASESSIAEDALRGPLARYFRHVEKIVTRTLLEAVARGDLDKAVKAKPLAVAIVAAIQGGFILSRLHNNPRYIRLATEGAAAMLEAHTKVRRSRLQPT
jgi:AcrR family transcriptional regulator